MDFASSAVWSSSNSESSAWDISGFMEAKVQDLSFRSMALCDEFGELTVSRVKPYEHNKVLQ